MAFTNDYDTSIPVDHQKFIDVPGLIRTLKSDLAERLADMISGFTSGETTEGIKKLIMRELSADPTAATDIGHLYCKDVAGATELFYQDALGNVKQLTNGGKLNVDATEAVLLSGAQTIAGIKTLSDQPVLSAGVKTDVISENTLDAGVTIDSCLIKDGIAANSDKVDGEDATSTNIKPFGSWGGKSLNTVYQAPTDGFVIYICGKSTAGADINAMVYSDSSNPPTTIRGWVMVGQATPDYPKTIITPVRKGDYYKCYRDGSAESDAIYWIPMGA